MSRILIIEDEVCIAELERDYLTLSGYETVIVNDGKEGLGAALSRDWDLVILDLMLPGVSGFEICRRIREEKNTPIIMVSAKKDDIDKIRGLGLGADDYMTKPFSPGELVARVKTQLRRYTQYNTAEPSVYDKDGLYVCGQTHVCELYGQNVPLTPIEFGILWYLCERRGQVVPSEELFEAVWGEKYLDNNNTVMAHIARLREKLNEPPRKPKFIKTVWGVGYKIDA